MTNKKGRVATFWLLGLFSILALAAWYYFGAPKGALNFSKRDILILTWISAQFGLAYRAFEMQDFDAPPWLAYFFSYQIRLLPASFLITTISILGSGSV